MRSRLWCRLPQRYLFLEVTLVVIRAVHGTVLVTKKKQLNVRISADMLKVQLIKWHVITL